MDFATKLKEMRTLNGLTQQELADKLDVSTSIIGDVERGARGISTNVALRLSKYFNTDVDYWLKEDDNNTNNRKFAIQPTTQQKNNLEELNKLIDAMLDCGDINKDNVRTLDKDTANMLFRTLVIDIEQKLFDKEQEKINVERKRRMDYCRQQLDEYRQKQEQKQEQELVE